MKLEYAKRGLQFFFVTLVVAERRQVLSSIAELEASGQAGASGRAGRPALLPLGEIVVAALRAVHRVWPAVTISDYVVMPDHLHFLLIADYNRDQGIAPLFIAHRFADAVERARALVEERNGRGSAPNPGRAPSPSEGPNPGRASHPGEDPDPGRAAGALAERRVEFMAGLLREAAAAACEAAPGELKVERGLRFGERRGGAGARAPVRSVVFARDCYIELSFDSRQLKAEPSARFVKLLPHALPARYDPSAEDSREIAAGRLVILSAFPDTPAVASPAMKRDPAASHRFRQNCLAMNDLAARLCTEG